MEDKGNILSSSFIILHSSPMDSRIDNLTREVDRLRRSRSVSDGHLQELILKAAEIQLNLAMQDKTLTKLDAAVNGNGKPGLVTRIDRVERLASVLTKVVWLLTAAAGTAAIKMLCDRLS